MKTKLDQKIEQWSWQHFIHSKSLLDFIFSYGLSGNKCKYENLAILKGSKYPYENLTRDDFEQPKIVAMNLSIASCSSGNSFFNIASRVSHFWPSFSLRFSIGYAFISPDELFLSLVWVEKSNEKSNEM